jgi:hypothetical protein
MHTTGKAGFLFSFDLAAAFLAVLLMLFLFFAKVGFEKDALLENSREKELQRFGLFLADSMVRNRCSEAPVFGSALFDEEKRRVASNRLDLALLENIGQIEGSGFFAARVSFKAGAKEEIFLLEEALNRNCVSFDRPCVLGGKKGLVLVTACEK